MKFVRVAVGRLGHRVGGRRGASWCARAAHSRLIWV